ncbi:MAG: ATP-binding protein [Acidobacteriota bacterium]
MAVTLSDLEQLLTEPEGERLEFKEAKTNFHFDKLVEYCAALANEGGGKILLGVTDARPRTVVSSTAFSEPGRTVSGIMERLRIRVVASEVAHPNGRVLVFEVAARPVGTPIAADGKYLARSGDTLRAMTQEELREIMDELGVDFSAQVEPNATIADLDPATIELFRANWKKRSQNAALDALTPIQLLEDAELIIDGKITRAALILLGTKAALGRYLGQAEVIFEYRNSESSISHQQRIEFRQGFLSFLDTIWSTINLRNEVVQYQDGLFRRDVPVMNETVVREAILNAVTHRDYRLPGSIFVKQFPRKLEITSPGGFPSGITLDNLLRKQSPRNRRIAETCARCGLVERSGQGVDRMFEESIREGKARPDFSGTDSHQVAITLLGEIQNPQFIKFLERVSAEKQISFSVEDLMILDAIAHGAKVGGLEGEGNLNRLVDSGVIEKSGRGRGVKFVLSRNFYNFLGKTGAYTRKRGLDRETNKALLLKHIVDTGNEGCALGELEEVLPAHSTSQVQKLLQELKADGKVTVSGLRRAGRWLSVSAGA